MSIYNKKGESISMKEYHKLFMDPEYKIVQQDTLDNGLFISTVWLGLDHTFGDEDKQIFETLVFEEGEWDDLYCERYSTEEEALQGHLRIKNEYEKIHNKVVT